MICAIYARKSTEQNGVSIMTNLAKALGVPLADLLE
jgi:hypothetical protein